MPLMRATRGTSRTAKQYRRKMVKRSYENELILYFSVKTHAQKILVEISLMIEALRLDEEMMRDFSRDAMTR